MKTPGITVRPLLNMAGHLFFNEVFFDNVHVPKRNLIGEENRGWYYTMIAMAFERTMGVVFAAGAQRLLDELVGFAKGTIVNGLPLSKNPSIRQNLADLAIEVEIARVIGYRIVWQQIKGDIVWQQIKGELPGYEAPMIKVFASETLQRMTDVGTQIMGLYGQLWLGSKWAPLHGMMADTYMNMGSPPRDDGGYVYELSWYAHSGRYLGDTAQYNCRERTGIAKEWLIFYLLVYCFALRARTRPGSSSVPSFGGHG